MKLSSRDDVIRLKRTVAKSEGLKVFTLRATPQIFPFRLKCSETIDRPNSFKRKGFG
jgi:hypothetical protein